MNKAIKVDAAGGTVDPQFIGVGNKDNVIVPVEVCEYRIPGASSQVAVVRVLIWKFVSRNRLMRVVRSLGGEM